MAERWKPIWITATSALRKTGKGARIQIARDYLANRDERPDVRRIAMANRREDLRAINDAICTKLLDRGEFAHGNVPAVGSDAGSRPPDQRRQAGVCIVFFENNWLCFGVVLDPTIGSDG